MRGSFVSQEHVYDLGHIRPEFNGGMASVTAYLGSRGEDGRAAHVVAPGQDPVVLGPAQGRALQIRPVTGLTGVAIAPQEEPC